MTRERKLLFHKRNLSSTIQSRAGLNTILWKYGILFCQLPARYLKRQGLKGRIFQPWVSQTSVRRQRFGKRIPANRSITLLFGVAEGEQIFVKSLLMPVIQMFLMRKPVWLSTRLTPHQRSAGYLTMLTE